MSRRMITAVVSSVSLIVAAAATTSQVLADEHDALMQQDLEVTLTTVATAAAPTAGTSGPGETVWIAERAGLVRVLGEEGLGEPVLDITAEISLAGEGGLLGIVFDETFEHFYVSFTNLDGDTVVDEFAVADGELQPDTRRTMFTQEQPFTNHNGGHLAFGPDGMLYISLGDGGSSGDPLDNGQNLETLLGTLLRIDPTGGQPYAIPPDNPFVSDPAARDEIWAYGLRNPWRFSFDAETGDLWIGDVGQNTREEVNRAPAGSGGGENYGWARMEGTLPFSGAEPDNHVPPVFEYDNDGARCSITGGYVYRGSAIPALRGMYLFSDYCDGTIRALDVQDGQVVGELDLGVTGRNVVSFVEGPDLELYALNIGILTGTVFRIDPVTPPSPSAPPSPSPSAPPSPSPSAPPSPSPSAPPSPSPSPPPATGVCSASYTQGSQWQGGFQGEVQVTAGSGAINGWSVAMTFPNGQTVTQIWNATLSGSGSTVTATNMGYNGALGAGQSTTYGFLGSWAGTNNPPTLTCTAS